MKIGLGDVLFRYEPPFNLFSILSFLLDLGDYDVHRPSSQRVLPNAPPNQPSSFSNGTQLQGKQLVQIFNPFLTFFRPNSDFLQPIPSLELPLLSAPSFPSVDLKTLSFPSLFSLLLLLLLGSLFPVSTKVPFLSFSPFLTRFRNAFHPRHPWRPGYICAVSLFRLATLGQSRPLHSNCSVFTYHLPRFQLRPRLVLPQRRLSFQKRYDHHSRRRRWSQHCQLAQLQTRSVINKKRIGKYENRRIFS